MPRKDPDKQRAYVREWVKRDREKRPELYREKSRRQGRELREQVIAAYGGACACCREDRVEFLALDHIDGGGAEHRRRASRGGRAVYREVRAAGFPKDKFRLLCHNCNMSRGFYGYCPHEVTP